MEERAASQDVVYVEADTVNFSGLEAGTIIIQNPGEANIKDSVIGAASFEPSGNAEGATANANVEADSSSKRTASSDIFESKDVDAKEFLREAEILRNLWHPNIIQFYGVCTSKEPVFIVTEFMSNGSLLSYLKICGESITLPEMISMMLEIASGMAYLESRQCIHGDVAARNIFIGSNNTCKIAGFTFSHFLKGTDQDGSKEIYLGPDTANVTVKWAPFEVLQHRKYSIKSDVWAFGILLSEIVTHGAEPYPGILNEEVQDLLCHGYRMPQMSECPDKLYEIMSECWNADRQKRPMFITLLQKLKDYDSSNDSLPSIKDKDVQITRL